MKPIATASMFVLMTLCAGGAAAQDDKKKHDAMAKDGMMKNMNMQECKEHMAMSKKDTMKKDDAMMKKDAMCAEMMKKDGMAGEPAKK